MRKIDADKVHKKINDEIEIAFKDYKKAREQSVEAAIAVDGYLRGLYWVKNKINCTKTLKSDENYLKAQTLSAYRSGYADGQDSAKREASKTTEYGYHSVVDMYGDIQYLKSQLVDSQREAAAYKKLLVDNKII